MLQWRGPGDVEQASKGRAGDSHGGEGWRLSYVMSGVRWMACLVLLE